LIKLIFQSYDGNEGIAFVIDRKTKSLKGISSKSNYKLVDKNWSELFDSKEEEIQSDVWTDEEFVNNIVYSMRKLGYIQVMA
jgi:hypothetical protein